MVSYFVESGLPSTGPKAFCLLSGALQIAKIVESGSRGRADIRNASAALGTALIALSIEELGTIIFASAQTLIVIVFLVSATDGLEFA